MLDIHLLSWLGRLEPYFFSARLLCDPDGGLGDILALGLFLQFRRFLHQLAGAVCEGLGAFTFLARFFTCG